MVCRQRRKESLAGRRAGPPQATSLRGGVEPRRRLEELARDVEADEPGVVVDAATRDLRQGRAESVREVDLEAVAAGALLDGKARIDGARVVAPPRRRFRDHVDRWADPEAAADAEHERVVIVRQLARQAVGVVDPDWLRV